MSAPLDIDQLQTFIAIVDTGSFTKAAGRVFKTQSAVSMQMRRLEERVGKQLFIKDGRGNRLTADGDKLLNYARRIIRLNSEAIAAFDDNRLEGTLRIGTPELVRRGVTVADAPALAALIAEGLRGTDPAAVAARGREMRARFTGLHYVRMA